MNQIALRQAQLTAGIDGCLQAATHVHSDEFSSWLVINGDGGRRHYINVMSVWHLIESSYLSDLYSYKIVNTKHFFIHNDPVAATLSFKVFTDL